MDGIDIYICPITLEREERDNVNTRLKNELNQPGIRVFFFHFFNYEKQK